WEHLASVFVGTSILPDNVFVFSQILRENAGHSHGLDFENIVSPSVVLTFQIRHCFRTVHRENVPNENRVSGTAHSFASDEYRLRLCGSVREALQTLASFEGPFGLGGSKPSMADSGLLSDALRASP